MVDFLDTRSIPKQFMVLLDTLFGSKKDVAKVFHDGGYHLDAIISSHALIHTGMTFSTGLYSESVADDAIIELSFLTGATYSAHLEISAQSGGNSVVQLYEGRTIAGGGAVVPRNKNRAITRNSAGATIDPDTICAETVTSAPSTSSGGTLIMNAYLYGGSGVPSTVGGSASGRSEWILKPSTQYTIRLQNLAGSAKPLALGLEWYEHPILNTQYPEVIG